MLMFCSKLIVISGQLKPQQATDPPVLFNTALISNGPTLTKKRIFNLAANRAHLWVRLAWCVSVVVLRVAHSGSSQWVLEVARMCQIRFV